MQASKGWKERSKGLPGMPRCGNGERSCVHERVTPKKWRWLPSRVERKSVYNCKASCFHHQVLQSRNRFLLNFPISFLDFFKCAVSFLIICLENSFLDYCSHANQELKHKSRKTLMSLGWAVCQFRQDHNRKKKLKAVNSLLWFRFNSSASAVTKTVITFCVLIEGPFNGIIWSFITLSLQKK